MTSINNSLFVTDILEHDVITVIMNMKNSTAGYDNIPASMLNTYEIPLTQLINRSFKEGVFRNRLKLATVIQVLKPGSSLLPSNYRPSSIVSFFSQIFGKKGV